jgi:hypothetical protein
VAFSVPLLVPALVTAPVLSPAWFFLLDFLRETCSPTLIPSQRAGRSSLVIFLPSPVHAQDSVLARVFGSRPDLVLQRFEPLASFSSCFRSVTSSVLVCKNYSVNAGHI